MDIKTNSRNNILIVDDTIENIKVLGTILMEEGFNISIAQSGKEAIEITDKKIPDLILLDINMSGMDGIETCNRLKTDPNKKSIPIIFLTAHIEIEYKKKAFDAGGVDYITKPFQKEEIVSRVKAHLGLAAYQNYLESEVEIRTKELQISNKKLEIEILKKKQAEESLIKSQKMESVGTLAGGLSHDMNNILSCITGTASIIKHKLINGDRFEDDQLLEYINNIGHACSRATNLTSQLLTLSKKHESKFEVVDLNKILKNTADIIKNTFDKSIAIKIEFYSEPALVKVDAGQIEQIILNLAINAAHSMTIMKKPEEKRGGTLTIILEKVVVDSYFCDKFPEAKVGEYFVFYIKDTGVGIDKSMQSKIFNPFFSTKRSDIGTGLGLSISYSIINKHAGIIDVYSEVGHGTDFMVYLPSFSKNKDAYEEEKINENNIQIKKNTGKILVIDDDEMIRIVLNEMLKIFGYNAIIVEDGASGIEEYIKYNSEIKAVILDLNLPDMSGIDVYNELKKIESTVKVLFATGFQSDERIVELISEGKVSSINKPINLNDLYTKISELLNH